MVFAIGFTTHQSLLILSVMRVSGRTAVPLQWQILLVITILVIGSIMPSVTEAATLKETVQILASIAKIMSSFEVPVFGVMLVFAIGYTFCLIQSGRFLKHNGLIANPTICNSRPPIYLSPYHYAPLHPPFGRRQDVGKMAALERWDEVIRSNNIDAPCVAKMACYASTSDAALATDHRPQPSIVDRCSEEFPGCPFTKLQLAAFVMQDSQYD